jgi:hypothetical protein
MATTQTIDKSFAYIDRLTKHGSTYAACGGGYKRILIATPGSAINFTGVSAQLTAQPLDIASDGAPSAYYVLTPKGITTLSAAANPVITAESVFDTGANRWIFYSGGNLIAPTANGGVRLQTAGGAVLATFTGILSESTAAAFFGGTLYVFDGKRGKMAVFTVTPTTLVYEGSFEAPNCREVLRAAVDGADLYCLNRHRVVRFSIASPTSPVWVQDYGKSEVEFTDMVVVGAGKIWFGFADSTPGNAGPEFSGPLYGVWDSVSQRLQTAAPKVSAWMLHTTTPYYTSETIQDVTPLPPPGAPTITVPTIGGGITRTWTLRTTPVDIGWHSVCYGNGLFVAVAVNGSSTNRVMTSPDGITWTSRVSASGDDWHGVCYGGGLFVAVAFQGGSGKIMTSPDGITWTQRTAPASLKWRSVAYGNGLFVAVADDGGLSGVMTSPDGVTWTRRSHPTDKGWIYVTYGIGLFVAVSFTGTGNRVMTSPDGINWTSRATPLDSDWYCLDYGNGRFAAVAGASGASRVMTSTDGVTWTVQVTPVTASDGTCICYGNGAFVAPSYLGTQGVVSSDGVNWSLFPIVGSAWRNVCYGNGTFVAVSVSGGANHVMTSPG